MTTLQVLVFITSLQQTHEFPALRYSDPHPTRFTCEAALERLDLKAVLAASKSIIHVPHKTIRRATASCVEVGDDA